MQNSEPESWLPKGGYARLCLGGKARCDPKAQTMIQLFKGMASGQLPQVFGPKHAMSFTGEAPKWLHHEWFMGMGFGTFAQATGPCYVRRSRGRPENQTNASASHYVPESFVSGTASLILAGVGLVCFEFSFDTLAAF